MSQDAVAVVIPVFNRATSVLEALDSVLGQTSPPARTFVVDDGSTDGTAAAVRAWVDQHDHADTVTLVEQANAGAALARNAGLALVATCPFVAFLDSDDLWPADFLARTQAALGADPEAVAASCDRRQVSPAPKPEVLDDLAVLAAKPVKWLLANGAGVLSCTLLRTPHVVALDAFKADLLTGQDWELLLRLSTRGTWLHCPGAPVTFRHGLASERGESDHLRTTFPDYKLRWARILEHFVAEQGGADVLPKATYRRELARRWSQAARQLIVLGRIAEARHAFRRSARWQKRPRTLLRLGLTYLRPGVRKSDVSEYSRS